MGLYLGPIPMHTTTRGSFFSRAGFLALVVASALPATAQTAGNFTLDPTGATTAKLGYYPIPVKSWRTARKV